MSRRAIDNKPNRVRADRDELGSAADRTGRSGCTPKLFAPLAEVRILGRETVDSASGAASLILTEQGRSVGSLGPGLTSDSADAVRAVLRDDLSAGPQVYGPHRRCRSDLPVLCKRPGFTGPTASGCVPSH